MCISVWWRLCGTYNGLQPFVACPPSVHHLMLINVKCMAFVTICCTNAFSVFPVHRLSSLHIPSRSDNRPHTEGYVVVQQVWWQPLYSFAEDPLLLTSQTAQTAPPSPISIFEVTVLGIHIFRQIMQAMHNGPLPWCVRNPVIGYLVSWQTPFLGSNTCSDDKL